MHVAFVLYTEFCFFTYNSTADFFLAVFTISPQLTQTHSHSLPTFPPSHNPSFSLRYIACHLPEVSALDSSYNSLGGEQCRALIDRASAKGLSGFVGQGGHNKPIDIESQSQKDIPKAALQLQLPSPIALSPSSQHCSPPNAPGKSAIARAGEKRFGVRLQPVTERDSEMDNTGPGTGNGPLKPTAAAQGKKGQGQGGKAKGKYMEESKDANLDPQDDIPYNSARTNVTSSGDE